MTVTLGNLQSHVERRVKSGSYASASEVMRAAVRALDREEAALTEWVKQQIDKALAEPRPSSPVKEVFARLRNHHARQVTRGAKKIDVTALFDMVTDGPSTDVARNKDKMTKVAAWRKDSRKVVRKRRRRPAI